MRITHVVSLAFVLAACADDKPQTASPMSEGGAASPPPSAAGANGLAGSAGAAMTMTMPPPAGSRATPLQPTAAGSAGAPSTAAGSGGMVAANAGASAGQSGAMPKPVITLTVDPERATLYDDAAKWLCLPGMKDELCTTGLDATVVTADGKATAEPHQAASEPSFDCFYVYPTVSNDSGSNADWNPDTQETTCVRAQAGRYSRVCRLFAPLYRQVTLTALNGNSIDDAARQVGYQDIVAAFNHYLSKYNDGRGFVLIGHSQGSGVLRRLMTAEIDGRPELRERLIAAHLLGTSVAVPEGQDVGGDFKNIPVCRRDDQIGCVLAYATFRAGSPPPSNSRFGKAASGRAVCANPAALGGGKGTLIPYLNPSEVRGGMRVATPFVSYLDFLEAECVERGDFTYLALSVKTGMQLPRDIAGDLTADWGLHMVDVHIAMGSLVNLAGAQAAAFAAQK